MIYKGQICDGCKKTMDECEDIVVCPVCGTPQHRSCWEERGECVNANKHAEGFVWHEKQLTQEEKAKLEGIKCPVCGKKNSADALSCDECGAPLIHNENEKKQDENKAPNANPVNIFLNTMNTPANPFLYGVKQDADKEIDGVKVKEIASFVQNSAPKYINKFEKTEKDEKGKRKISFNWAAFFFAPIWFFYRKLWKIGILFACALLAITIAFTNQAMDFSYANEGYATAISQYQKEEISEDELNKKADAVVNASISLAPMLGLNLALALLAGFSADTLYKKFTVAKIKDFKAKARDTREFDAITLSKGGTSFLFAFLGYIGYNMIYQLLLYLATLI